MIKKTLDHEDDCDECNLKDEKISGQEKMLDEKEMTINEKSAAIRALQSKARTAAVDKAAADKRVIEAEKARKLLVEKTKEVESLKVEMLTKDAIKALQNKELKDSSSTASPNNVEEEVVVEEEIIVEAELKKV